MPENTGTKIAVNPNAGAIDTLTALGRYVLVIITAVPAVIALLKSHDLAGLIAYFRSDTGAGVVAAIVAIGTIAYGLFKTHKRGAQLGDAALDPANKNVVPK